MDERTRIHYVFAMAVALVTMALPPSLMAQAPPDLVNPFPQGGNGINRWGVEIDEGWRLIWDGHELANHEAIQIMGSCEEPYELQLGVIDTLQLEENMELFHQRLVETMISLCVPLPPGWNWDDYDFDDPADLEYICSYFGITVEEARAAAEQEILDNPNPSEDDLIVLRLLQNPAGDPDEDAALYLEESIFLEGFFQLFGAGALEPSFDGEYPRYLLERTSQEVTSMEEVASATYEVVAGRFYQNATATGPAKVVLAMVQHVIFVDGREAHLFQPATVYEAGQGGTAKADARAWAEEDSLPALIAGPLEPSASVQHAVPDLEPPEPTDCASNCYGVANADRALARTVALVGRTAATLGLAKATADCAVGCWKVTWWSGWGAVICVAVCIALALVAFAIAIAAINAVLTATLNVISASLVSCLGGCGIYFKVDASWPKAWRPRGGDVYGRGPLAADCLRA